MTDFLIYTAHLISLGLARLTKYVKLEKEKQEINIDFLSVYLSKIWNLEEWTNGKAPLKHILKSRPWGC